MGWKTIESNWGSRQRPTNKRRQNKQAKDEMAKTSSSKTLKASDIAPAAFAKGGKGKRKLTAAADDQRKADDLEYDLGNLMACDNHPMSEQEYRKGGERWVFGTPTLSCA